MFMEMFTALRTLTLKSCPIAQKNTCCQNYCKQYMLMTLQAALIQQGLAEFVKGPWLAKPLSALYALHL